MRSCDEILELLSAALDGELTGSERRELDAHLDVCPACRALFAELSGLDEAAREPEEAPAGFAQRVMEQVAAHPAQEGGRPDTHPAPKRFPVPWRKWAGWAAVVAVVLLAAVALPDHLHMGYSNDGTSSGEAVIDTQKSAMEAEGQIPNLDSGFEQEETDGGISAQADLPEESADSFGAEAAHSRLSAAYCGVLVLTSGPLPEGLEDYGATEDKEGRLAYEVPAGYYFSCAADLIEQNASNFVNDNGSWMVDPAAEYGLIVVAFEP